MMTTERKRVLAALLSLYLIWGSTFLVIRYALESFPPLLMAALRFLVAGAVLFAWEKARGAALPTARQWRSALLVGTLLTAANGCVVIAEQWVTSGVAAMAIASVPLWVALFSGLFGRWPTRGEWLGLAVGLLGVAVLQSGTLQASPAGAAVLTVSCVSWALGSIYSRRLDLPKGLMSSAAQMLAGGSVLLAASLLHGERMGAPTPRSLVAFAYLVVAGSVVGYSAYQFLLSHVRPTLATSYAYVNPVVAVGLGSLLAGEAVGLRSMGALGLILGGVGLMALRK